MSKAHTGGKVPYDIPKDSPIYYEREMFIEEPRRKVWHTPLPKMPPESELRLLEIGSDLDHYFDGWFTMRERGRAKIAAAKARWEQSCMRVGGE